jgi:hypothetical protein
MNCSREHATDRAETSRLASVSFGENVKRSAMSRVSPDPMLLRGNGDHDKFSVVIKTELE